MLAGGCSLSVGVWCDGQSDGYAPPEDNFYKTQILKPHTLNQY